MNISQNYSVTIDSILVVCHADVMLSKLRAVGVVPASVLLLSISCHGPATSVAPLAQRSAVVIRGSGSTFAARYYKAVIPALTKSVKDITVEYRPIGSGRGKAEFSTGATDFAGTDSTVKDTDGPKPGEFLYVPTTAGAIAVAFHLRGVNNLRFSPSTLAKIFQRDIRQWNDPEIASENPNIALPQKSIGVVHRADRSGTTSNFTKFLDSAAAGVWRLGFGDAVAWPVDTSQGDGNSRVAQILDNNNGAIGYVDLADAKALNLRVAAIRNKSGAYVLPTSTGVTAALSEATFTDGLTYQPLDATGVLSYPLTAPTYILIRTNYSDQRTVDGVSAFLNFILTEGQDLAVRANYARLPEPLRKLAIAQVQKIRVS